MKSVLFLFLFLSSIGFAAHNYEMKMKVLIKDGTERSTVFKLPEGKMKVFTYTTKKGKFLIGVTAHNEASSTDKVKQVRINTKIWQVSKGDKKILYSNPKFVTTENSDAQISESDSKGNTQLSISVTPKILN